MERHTTHPLPEAENVRDPLPYAPPKAVAEESGQTYQRRRRAGRTHIEPQIDMDEETPDAKQPDRPPRSGKAAKPQKVEVLATNRTVCLASALGAMSVLFALFLLQTEHDSRAIRWNSMQSVLLRAAHLLLAAALWLLATVIGWIPILGYLVTLLCWLCYFGMLLWLTMQRYRLMQAAWQGLRFQAPVIGNWAKRWYR